MEIHVEEEFRAITAAIGISQVTRLITNNAVDTRAPLTNMD